MIGTDDASDDLILPSIGVIDADGWCTGALSVPSPNFDQRPDGVCPDLLVIHNISLPPGQFGGDAIVALFTNTLDCDSHPFYQALCGLRVSAHFLVRRDGTLLQFVACGARAWHAGHSSYRGRERCNDFSIGIELEGCDDRPFEPRQYGVLAALTSVLAHAYPLVAVAGHDEIAPGRKTDPGPFFDWHRYLRDSGQVLAHLPRQGLTGPAQVE